LLRHHAAASEVVRQRLRQRQRFQATSNKGRRCRSPAAPTARLLHRPPAVSTLTLISLLTQRLSHVFSCQLWWVCSSGREPDRSWTLVVLSCAPRLTPPRAANSDTDPDSSQHPATHHPPLPNRLHPLNSHRLPAPSSPLSSALPLRLRYP
jgi:hypothetical protein